MNGHQEPGAADSQWRLELARAWTAEVSKTVFIPMSHARIERLLLTLSNILVDAVLSDPFDVAPVADIGTALVNRSMSGKTTLATTVDLLGRRLLAMPEQDAPADLPDRVVSALSVLTASYAEALRERTYIAQEALKRALVKTKRDTERTLAESEARLRAIFSSSAVGIAISDLAGRFLQTNDSLCEILGYSSSELAAMTVHELQHEDTAAQLGGYYADLVAGRRRRFRERARLTRGDGDAVWAYLAVSVLLDDEGAPAYLVTMVEDVTELHLLGDRLGHQSLHDMLTGLPNRQYFMSTVEGSLGRGMPTGRISLFHFGLDRFTVINDGLGQHLGDQLLRVVAKRLEDVFSGESAMVARLGGDEFAALLESSPTTPGVAEFAMRILERLAEPVYIGGDGVAVTTCVGIVDRVEQGTDPVELLRAADITLHRAKRRGAGQWDLYDADQDAADRARFRLAATIPGALHNDELGTEFQPLLRFSDESLLAVTARITWSPPGQGTLRHNEVLALAEETGVVLPVGRWVIGKACEQARAWECEFGDGAPAIVVDLSASQARDPDLVGAVRRLLDDTGLAIRRLRLGITLGGGDNEEIIDNIMVLAEMGVQAILLGYGSEHVDLLRRMEFPLRAVVLDRRLSDALADVGAAQVTEPVVASLVEFAHGCGLPVAAVGIQHEEHLRRLRAVGVDGGQGEQFVPSGSAEKIAPWLGKR